MFKKFLSNVTVVEPTLSPVISIFSLVTEIEILALIDFQTTSAQQDLRNLSVL
jgi:hypothetical protein